MPGASRDDTARPARAFPSPPRREPPRRPNPGAPRAHDGSTGGNYWSGSCRNRSRASFRFSSNRSNRPRNAPSSRRSKVGVVKLADAVVAQVHVGQEAMASGGIGCRILPRGAAAVKGAAHLRSDNRSGRVRNVISRCRSRTAMKRLICVPLDAVR